MVQYSDYQNILLSTNFVGGAGQGALPNPGNDDRAEVTADGNGIYQFSYLILASLSDMDNLGYYDTANNDIGSDGIYDREYDELPSGNDPGVTNFNQLSILASVLNASAYGVSFADVANINFNSGTTSTANIVIGETTSGSGITNDTGGYELDYSNGWNELKHGDIWLNSDATDYWDSNETGSAGYFAIMHELAHSLGLAHTDSTPSIDSQQYSIMSTTIMDGMDPAGSNNEVTPFGLQLLDIAALQEIYGVNYSTRSGNTTYSDATAFASSRPNDAFIYTIWDGGGNDTIDASGYTDGVTIDLREGHFSSIGESADSSYSGSRGTGLADNNVAIAYNAEIENAIGTDDSDTLIGNDLNNVLTGNDGNDNLYGNGGNDILAPGNGTNTLDGGTGTDTVDYSDVTSSVDVNLLTGSDSLGNTLISIERVIASAYGGTQTGTNGNDSLYSGMGNDTLNGGAGNDSYYYELGGGNDTIQDTWSGTQTVYLGSGINAFGVLADDDGSDVTFTFTDSKTLTFDNLTYGTVELEYEDGSKSGLLIVGNGSDNALYSQTNMDTYMFGRNGNDGLYLSSTQEGNYSYLNGGAGNDTYNTNQIHRGISIAEDVSGDDYYDATSNYSVSDTYITDFAGNDYYLLNYDFSVLDHGGNDEYVISSPSQSNDYGGFIEDQGGNDKLRFATVINQYDGHSQSGNHLIVEINSKHYTFENYYLSSNYKIEEVRFNDTGFFDFEHLLDSTNVVFGNNQNNSSLLGNSADNTIYGFDGDDTLNGGDGNDTLIAGDDDDILIGGSGNDILNGGDGIDTVDYSTSTVAVEILLASNSVDEGRNSTINDSLSGIENAIGSSFADDIRGNDGNNELHGGAGDDYLLGGLGNDTLYGDDDDDSLYGREGMDTLYGGAGDDILRGEDDNDELHGGDGKDDARGGGGADIIYGDAGNDRLEGNDGNDTLYGGADSDNDIGGFSGGLFGGNGDDILYGEAGSDRLYGENDNDILYGGADTDALRGGSGNDILFGEGGNDNLWGEAGADTFSWLASDVGNGVDDVKDFSLLDGDMLDVSDIISANYDPLTDAITDFIQITDDGTHSRLYADADGGADNFIYVALVRSVIGLTDEAALELNGTLITV